MNVEIETRGYIRDIIDQFVIDPLTTRTVGGSNGVIPMFSKVLLKS